MLSLMWWQCRQWLVVQHWPTSILICLQIRYNSMPFVVYVYLKCSFVEQIAGLHSISGRVVVQPAHAYASSARRSVLPRRAPHRSSAAGRAHRAARRTQSRHVRGHHGDQIRLCRQQIDVVARVQRRAGRQRALHRLPPAHAPQTPLATVCRPLRRSQHGATHTRRLVCCARRRRQQSVRLRAVARAARLQRRTTAAVATRTAALGILRGTRARSNTHVARQSNQRRHRRMFAYICLLFAFDL